MAEPEYVKITIKIEKEDGSKIVTTVPIAQEVTWDASYSEPRFFDAKMIAKPVLQRLTLGFQPLSDEQGVMYTEEVIDG